MKGSLESALGEAPKGPPSAPAEGGELEDCMSDLGEALMDSDWAAAAAAFRRGHEICAGGYEDEEEPIEEA